MAKLTIETGFAITPNELLNNPHISWKAKGLYGYLQSKPSDWDFSIERIQLDSLDGKDSTRSGIQELEGFGYLTRAKFKNEKGQWDIEYILHTTPQTIAENPTRSQQKTMTENPSLENPSTENPPTNKERNSNKEIVIKRYINNGEENLNFWLNEFEISRKKLRKPMTERARILILNKLKNIDEKEAIELLKTSIERGWSTIYPKNIQARYTSDSSTDRKQAMASYQIN